MYLAGLAKSLWYCHMSVEPNIDNACEKGFMIMAIILSMTAGKVGCKSRHDAIHPTAFSQSHQRFSPNVLLILSILWVRHNLHP